MRPAFRFEAPNGSTRPDKGLQAAGRKSIEAVSRNSIGPDLHELRQFCFFYTSAYLYETGLRVFRADIRCIESSSIENIMCQLALTRSARGEAQ